MTRGPGAPRRVPLRRVPLRRAGGAAGLLRAATMLLAWLVAGGELAVGPERGVALLAAAAAVVAALGVAVPVGGLPAVALLLLLAEHVVADPAPRADAALAAGAALWCLHALYDLCAVAPAGTDLDRSVVLRWLQRQGAVLAVALPVGALALCAGAAPGGAVLPWVGLLAAAGLVLVPVLVLRVSRR